MSASIRVAVSADAGEIAELGNQLGYDLGTPETTERIRRILSRTDQRVVVAEVNRIIVGWVHAIFAEYFESEAFVLIGGLVVDKDHRRQGIAGMLMASAEQWARERGCFVVRLTSSSTRIAAHRFYERIGYEHIKTQYAFVKALDAAPQKDNGRFVPKVED
jgi:GNAT superfamily N-acetyltransferase